MQEEKKLENQKLTSIFKFHGPFYRENFVLDFFFLNLEVCIDFIRDK